MLPSAVMGPFPLGIDYGTFSNLDNAIAGRQPRLPRRIDEFNVRPLVAMMMDVVGDFTEQDAFLCEDAIGFAGETRKRVGEGVMIFL